MDAQPEPGGAFLIRQLGIIIPFTVLVYLFLNKKLNIKKTLIIAVLPVIVLLAHRYWLHYVHGLTWAYLRGEDLKIAFNKVGHKKAEIKLEINYSYKCTITNY